MLCATICSSPSLAKQTSAETKKQSEERSAPADGNSILVAGRRTEVIATPEGTAYDVRKNAHSQTGTAAEVLGTIPGVNIGPDGSMTVRGNSNVQIYVNGRPSAALNGENQAPTLQAISGGSIASVEVITNPSARLEANGGTIVNIVLDRVRGKGLQGTVTAGAGDRGRKNATINATYGGEKLSATFNASLRDEVRLTEVDDDRSLLGPGGGVVSRYVTMARYTPTHSLSASVGGSLVYALSAAADLGADLSVNTGSPKNTVYERHADFSGSADPVARYERIRRGTYYNNGSDISLYYKRHGPSGGATLSIVGQRSRSSVRSTRPFTTEYEFPSQAPTGELIMFHTISRIDRVSLDHERPVGDGFRLGLGSEWKREANGFYNGRSTFDPASPGPLPSLSLAAFEAVQRIAAAYVTLQFRSGPWTLQAGGRFEKLDISVRSAPDGFYAQRHLSGFNHNFSVMREIGRDLAILRFSRTLQRFDPKDLNPTPLVIDPLNRSVGNPELLPQRVTSIEVEYGINRGMTQATATLYYRRSDDTIADYSEYLPDNILLTSKRNGGRSHSFGSQLAVTGKIGSRLQYSLTGNLFYAQLAASAPTGIQRRSRVSYTGQLSLDWQASTRDQLHLDANIQGPSLVPFGYRTRAAGINAIWRHKISPRLAASLTMRGLIQNVSVRTLITTPTAEGVNRRENNSRAVLLSLTYKLG